MYILSCSHLNIQTVCIWNIRKEMGKKCRPDKTDPRSHLMIMRTACWKFYKTFLYWYVVCSKFGTDWNNRCGLIFWANTTAIQFSVVCLFQALIDENNLLQHQETLECQTPTLKYRSKIKPSVEFRISNRQGKLRL